MQIQGRNKVIVNYEAKYRQPYPVLKDKLNFAGKDADLVVSLGEAGFDIDGKGYTGYLFYVLDEVK